MKNVLIAIDNEVLLNQIKKCGKYIVYGYDIDNKENVIEYLKKYKTDILITKDTLEGNIDKKEYIKTIKELQNDIKIILCVEKLDEDYKGFLLANNVINIIEGKESSFSKMLEMIDSKQGIIICKEENKENTEANKQKINVITKQKVCVFGTSGAGKSYIASMLSQITSKNFKLNTILIDMDIQNAAIDIYNNINNSTNSLQYLMEEIDRDSFDSGVFLELANRVGKNGKLSFITNNMGIYECQNKISDIYYDKLYKEAENNCDILIVDLPAAPFLDVVPFSLQQADKIFFVINPNFISIRQAIKYLDLLTNIWKINKDRIYIVVNRIKKESLSIKQIESILKDFNVLFWVKEDSKVESIINGLATVNCDDLDCLENISNVFGISIDESTKKNKERIKNDH